MNVVLSVLLLGGSAFASGEWPPGADHLSQVFSEERENFNSLVIELKDSSWVRMCSGLGSAPLLAFAYDGGRRELRGGDAPKIREMLDSTLVDCVELLTNGGVRFIPLLQYEGGGFSYIIRLSFSGGKTQIGECETEQAVKEASGCVITLDDEWRLEYRWYPLTE